MPSIKNSTEWPSGILRQFSVQGGIYLNAESRYYGPYNTLFAWAFGITQEFELFLFPQAPPSTSRYRESVDFTVSILVTKGSHPLFVIEIKNDYKGLSPGGREEAHKQVVDRFAEIMATSPFNTIYGISLIGTWGRIYTCDKTDDTEVIISPAELEEEEVKKRKKVSSRKGSISIQRKVLHGYPGWRLDILSQEGFNAIKELVQKVKDEGNTYEDEA